MGIAVASAQGIWSDAEIGPPEFSDVALRR
jgi:hypothetical protein